MIAFLSDIYHIVLDKVLYLPIKKSHRGGTNLVRNCATIIPLFLDKAL